MITVKQAASCQGSEGIAPALGQTQTPLLLKHLTRRWGKKTPHFNCGIFTVTEGKGWKMVHGPLHHLLHFDNSHTEYYRNYPENCCIENATV